MVLSRRQFGPHAALLLTERGYAHTDQGRSHGYPFEPDPSDPTMFFPGHVQALYHGTDADLSKGSMLTVPGKLDYLRSLGYEHPGEGPGTYGGHRLFMTDDPEWAGAHGRNIYQVVPHGQVRQMYGSNFLTHLPLSVVARYGTGSRSLLTGGRS